MVREKSANLVKNGCLHNRCGGLSQNERSFRPALRSVTWGGGNLKNIHGHQLTLIYLGEMQACGIHFRTHAFHHTKWMSKIIACFKCGSFPDNLNSMLVRRDCRCSTSSVDCCVHNGGSHMHQATTSLSSGSHIMLLTVM